MSISHHFSNPRVTIALGLASLVLLPTAFGIIGPFVLDAFGLGVNAPGPFMAAIGLAGAIWIISELIAPDSSELF
jgi:hypothetical protein